MPAATCAPLRSVIAPSMGARSSRHGRALWTTDERLFRTRKLLTSTIALALVSAGVVAGAGAATAASSATGTSNGMTVTVAPTDAVTGWDVRRELEPKPVTIQVTVPEPFTDTSYGSKTIVPVTWRAYVESRGEGACGFTETLSGTATGSATVGPYVQQTDAPGQCTVNVRVVASRETKLPAGNYQAEVNVSGASYLVRAASLLSTPEVSAAKVARGKAVTVSGTLKEEWNFTRPVVAGGVVRLQFRAVGSQTWQDVAETTTDSKGVWSVKHTPKSSGHYRAWAPDTQRLLTAASPAVKVTVAASSKTKVKLSKPKAAKATVKAGKAVKVSGKFAVAKSGKYKPARATLTVQYKAKGTSYWVNVKKVKTNAKGAWSTTVKMKRTGQVRVVHKATNTRAKATSAATTVKVK